MLLTGRVRRTEADQAREAVLDPVEGAPSARDRAVQRDRHLIVVATQTLEVGADLDFDIAVTETCGVRALTQRLGRLNRLGRCPDPHCVILHAEKEKHWGLYGEEPSTVWEALVRARDEGPIDLSPNRVAEILGSPTDAPPAVPELLPFHLWDWAKTTAPPPQEAPVELFYEGFATDGPRVSICWRATRFSSGDRLVPSISVDEAVDLPLGEARAVLVERLGETAQLLRLARDRVTIEDCQVGALRPGDLVVLDTQDGLYDDHGWSPASTAPVQDLSLGRWPGLPIDEQTLRRLLPSHADLLSSLVAPVVEADDEALRAMPLEALIRALREIDSCANELRDVIADLDGRFTWMGSVPVLTRPTPTQSGRASTLLAADAFDDLSADSTAVGLDQHLGSVGEIAERLARAVGLPEALIKAVEQAGRFHDLGKADPRFQRWLDPEATATAPLAKSTTSRTQWRQDRASSGWPAGGRHEVLSARLLDAWWASREIPEVDIDLVRHLVLAHHGHGRPLVKPVEDREANSLELQLDGTTMSISGDLAATDWDQPRRFRSACERYGYWGLALLEAIVRQADHLASSQAGRGPVEVA